MPISMPALPPDPFEYYDAGNHWCKNCNVTSGSMFDFFTHCHSKTHQKTLDPYNRPWASTTTGTIKNTGSEEKLSKPAKGSEFLLPIRGFFCLLCNVFTGDAICAEEHVTTHAHNEKYKKQIHENPLYEQRRNLDRQAGLALQTSGKKRKHGDDEKGSKDKEEKSKHKKEKRKEEEDTNQKEEKSKVKEEAEEKLSKNEDYKQAKILEEERPSYSKKEEDEKFTASKKDDKSRHSHEEEDKVKYGRRGDDRFRYSGKEERRYRHHREEDNRYEDRLKYGAKEGEDKCKYSNLRSRYDSDEGKLNPEKEAFKKSESGRSEGSKLDPPPKPYDPPKIFCGPSPAMRAKLRKQNLEAEKSSSVIPSFGKFTWKKKENILSKEAQKVAADFIKEDEAAAKEDSFAKSMAVAKEIAKKLGTQPNMAPPWVSNSTNRGRIRPNLPAPAAILRTTTMMGKPAPLNTFLSMSPQSANPLPKDTLPDTTPPNPTHFIRAQNPAPEDLQRIPGPHTVAIPKLPLPGVSKPSQVDALPAPGVSKPSQVDAPPVPGVSKPSQVDAPPVPGVSKPSQVDAPPVPGVSKPSQVDVPPVPGVSKPSQDDAPPVPGVSRPSQVDAPPVPGVSKMVMVEVNSAPPVWEPASIHAKHLVPELKPSPPEVYSAPPETPPPSTTKTAQPTVIKIVSDVAAPGVPESEQTHTVFIKPPPFMVLGNAAPRSEKPKSILAAAKAQDLFGIFYSSSHSGASSITKPLTDYKANESSFNKPREQKVQPQNQHVTQSHPPAIVSTTLQPASPTPQIQSELDIQISSVWSLQSTPTHDVALSETASPPTQPDLSVPEQAEAQNVPENQTLQPDSKLLTENKSVDLDPIPQKECHSEPMPGQDVQDPSQPKPDCDTAAVPEPKPGPKTRSKAISTQKPPGPHNVRQTRSQTRYQTRQQQQLTHSEPQADSTSGESGSVSSDPTALGTSHSVSGEETTNEGGPQPMDITPETMSLPPSVDFETDFNFE